MVEERLSVFEDEPDLNDWVEVMCGAAMAYKESLVHAYESAWEDGVITEAELAELKSFQEALGISDQEAADLNVKAAIKSAAADGEITKDEAKSIEAAAKAAKMSEADTAKAVSKELDKKDGN